MASRETLAEGIAVGVRPADASLTPAAAVARAVARRREELGMGQEALAKRMGTSQNQVWRIESGEANLTLRSLQKLEEVLGISLIARPGEDRNTMQGKLDKLGERR